MQMQSHAHGSGGFKFSLPDGITDTSSLSFYTAKSRICSLDDNGNPGRGVFAGNDYAAGEEIGAKRRPTIASLDTERLGDTCANCFVWTAGVESGGGAGAGVGGGSSGGSGSRLYVKEGVKVSACAGCKRFRYCSKACQKEAWSRGHKFECKALKQEGVIDRPMPKAVLATMEVLIRRKHGLLAEQEWGSFVFAQSHVDDFKGTGQYAGIELMAMGVGKFSGMEGVFDRAQVAAMYARVLTNSLTLITPTLDPLGIIFDPVLSSINHSCDPNAFVMMDGPVISIRTLKPIKKNEEIFISYIDTTNPYPRRQSELKSRWFFTCRCSKCQKGPVLVEDKWAIQPSQVGEKWKEMADQFIKNEGEEGATDPANYTGDSLDQKRVAALQGHIFSLYQTAQATTDPASAIKIIEDGMRICHQSKLWPVYRQPYAALRDELIVNLLEIGDYQGAWRQCAKRYRDVLPNLYEQAFHPVRVVLVWQSAMLAWWVLGEGGVEGGDFGMIAFLLIMEVMNLVPLSHGKDSAFAKSVEKKYTEMVQDMKQQGGDDLRRTLTERLPLAKEQLNQMGTWAEY